MSMRYTSPTRVRQTKRFSIKLWGISILGAGLALLVGYDGIAFIKDTTPPAELASSKTKQSTSLPKNVQLAWPVTGQAAVGSVEDGVLASSAAYEEPQPTASMAKVIAALAIMKKQPFSQGQTGKVYTFTAQDVAIYRSYAAKGGSVVPVYDGMKLTQYQALQAMLIPSANNIAASLVDKVFGSEAAYISYAQSMLYGMGLSRTVIDDASGFSARTVSTPSELVAIGIQSLKNPVIAEIVAQPQAQIPGIGLVKNTNQLLGTNGVVGIKTGTTDSAGNCLLFAAKYVDKKEKAVTIVGVIMGEENPESLFGDSGTLLASARQAYGLIEASSATEHTDMRQPRPMD